MSPETILFAIQASIRLYKGTRKAYADDTRGRPIVLPLPPISVDMYGAAHNWFANAEAGIAVREAHLRIAWLMDLPERNDEQKAELSDLYAYFRDDGDQDIQGRLSTDEIGAMLEIRQWAEDEAGQTRTALQQVAGTLVNIAVDYFVQVPGAVSTDRPEGRALLAFFRAMDQTDFANTAVTDVAGALIVGIVEAVAETPELLGGGRNEQLLVQGVAEALAAAAKEHLATATTAEKRDASVWLQLLGRAMLKSGAETVLANPQRFLSVEDDAQAAVISQVGGVLAELLIGEKRMFDRILSVDGLDTLVKAALGAVAKNPGVLGIDNGGLRNVIVAVAESMGAAKDPLSPDMFPEMVRLVLAKTADNADLIFGKRFTNPDRHLLVTAMRQLLKSLSKKPPAGSTWTPSFTKEQVLDIAEAVFDEVVDNPGWVVDRAGNASKVLGTAVQAMLESLRKLDSRRVSASAGVAMLKAGLKAVALQLPLIQDLPEGGQDAGRVAITAALDAILGTIFGEEVNAEASWALAGNAALEALVSTALERLARIGSEQKHVDVLRTVFGELVEAGKPVDPVEFAQLLEARLEAA